MLRTVKVIRATLEGRAEWLERWVQSKVLLLEKESIYKNKREVATWQRYKVRCQEINQAGNKKV